MKPTNKMEVRKSQSQSQSHIFILICNFMERKRVGEIKAGVISEFIVVILDLTF